MTIDRIDLPDLLLIAEAATGVPAQQLKHDVDDGMAWLDRDETTPCQRWSKWRRARCPKSASSHGSPTA